MGARIFGSGERIAAYEIEDTQLAVGSTLGGPKGAIVIKASGAIGKFYSSDLGLTLMSGISIQFWDGPTGAARPKIDGKFRIHPDFQEYAYRIDDGVSVVEKLFLLNGKPRGNRVDPLTAYLMIEMRNDSGETHDFDSLSGVLLRGDTRRDVRASYDGALRALVAWNVSAPNQGRAIGCSRAPTSFEVTTDHGKMTRPHFAGKLSDTIVRNSADPVGLFHHRHHMAPGRASPLLVHARWLAGGRARRAALVPQRTGRVGGTRADEAPLRRGARALHRRNAGRTHQPRRALGKSEYAAYGALYTNGLGFRQRSDALQ